jgi:hypothetical protein
MEKILVLFVVDNSMLVVVVRNSMKSPLVRMEYSVTVVGVETIHYRHFEVDRRANVHDQPGEAS